MIERLFGLEQVTYFPENWDHANVYLIHGQKDYLIDPAIPYDPAIAENLGLTLATHFHFDHVNQVDAWRERGGLKFIMPQGDIPLLTDPEANCSLMFGQSRTFAPADAYYRDEEIIQEEDYLRFKVYHTPGHCPGCSCLLLEVADSGHKDPVWRPLALITGDTLFAESIGRTDLKGGNPAVMRESLARLVKLMRKLPGDLPVLPGHGSPCKISDLFRHNFYILSLVQDQEPFID